MPLTETATELLTEDFAGGLTCLARLGYIGHRRLPFDVRVPNPKSREAMREIETGVGLARFVSTEELFRDLEV